MPYNRKWSNIKNRIYLDHVFIAGISNVKNITASKFLKKWLPLGLIAGIAGGFVSILFYLSLITFYDISAFLISKHIAFYLILPPIGFVISFLILHYAKLDNIHPMDDLIKSFHNKEDKIRKYNWIPILFASTLSLGLGGSGGPEAPVSYMSASFTNFFSGLFKNIFNFSSIDKKTFVLSSIAGALGAIFKAPFGGAIFALEIPYSHDIESGSTIPALIAGVVGYLVYGGVVGFQPLVQIPYPQYTIVWIPFFVYIILTGVIAGLVSILIIKLINANNTFLKSLKKYNILLPVFIAGSLIAYIDLFEPYISGEGENVIYSLFDMNFNWFFIKNYGALALFWVILFLVIFLISKIMSTTITLGSGMPLGIFFPSLVIGSLIGEIVGLSFHLSNIGIDILVTVGMASVLAGTTKTPIASVLIITETVGIFTASIPLALGVIVSYILTGENTMNKSQLVKKGIEIDYDILKDLKVKDACRTNILTVSIDSTIGQAREIASKEYHVVIPVVIDNENSKKKVVGIIYTESLKKTSHGFDDKNIITIMQSHFDYVDMDKNLLDAYNLMVTRDIARLIVVDSKDKFKLYGILTMSDILSILSEKIE